MAHFYSIFPILGAKKIVLENLALSHTTSHGFLKFRKHLEKTNKHGKIQKKQMIQLEENAWTEGRTERRKGGQTLFQRTLPATAGGPIMIKSILKSCWFQRLKSFVTETEREREREREREKSYRKLFNKICLSNDQ